MKHNQKTPQVSGIVLVPVMSIDIVRVGTSIPEVAPGTPIMPEGFLTETAPAWDRPVEHWTE